jgi:hypothetical protein
MTEDYMRDDIYYCECCGVFYDRKTHETVNVGLHEIPADFALEVMADRQQNAARKQRRERSKSRGFSK